MSISGILSSSTQYQIGATNPLQQQFQQLGQALQSGNLSSAQSDFATIQAAFSQPSTATGNATSNPVQQAFNQLASDLQSGNLSAAQKDYSTVQQNLGTHGTVSRREFGGQPDGGGVSGGGQNALFPGLGQNPTTGTLASAQQSYVTMQQELQQVALSETASLTSESPISFDA